MNSMHQEIFQPLPFSVCKGCLLFHRLLHFVELLLELTSMMHNQIKVGRVGLPLQLPPIAIQDQIEPHSCVQVRVKCCIVMLENFVRHLFDSLSKLCRFLWYTSELGARIAPG